MHPHPIVLAFRRHVAGQTGIYSLCSNSPAKAVNNPAMSQPLIEVWGCSLLLLEFLAVPFVPHSFYAAQTRSLAVPSRLTRRIRITILSAEVSAILFVDRGFSTTLLAKVLAPLFVG
ncbi:hypothetical protein K435DRAFT_856350 [Dendrothele bispora CBS 962.96]|uniref:Uncharacterized protein n=1 Tax=Dendrothele bispora (strain CBS 962.96) TaxID=1314807 RepID=A0A4S8M8L8_DENBC|nr:hypothetical protein K435DRAFT_856350 [Dendrothele bispora CBS 962.96]